MIKLLVILLVAMALPAQGAVRSNAAGGTTFAESRLSKAAPPDQRPTNVQTRAASAAAQRASNVVSRTAKARNSAQAPATTRGGDVQHRGTNSLERAAIKTTPRQLSQAAPAARAGLRQNTTISRSATTARAAATTGTAALDSGYNACRDTYFTCMDQFCATRDESYRRCACSSRLAEIQGKERAISQTGQQLQDFADLNLAVVKNSANEVKAMMSATAGEKSIKNDTSGSAQQLAGISAVLAGAKTKALNAAGTLDIAGDVSQIWNQETLLIGSANIATLTGEPLYNAVHAQCSDFAKESCAKTATLNMAVSAYGMYIENDCNMLATNLKAKKQEALGDIRTAGKALETARIENYDAHNLTGINDCILQVRKDITHDSACGENYVHCLDISGKYLNIKTGSPIYSIDFYQLEQQLSLDGDVLQNPVNRMTINDLNKKKEFAARGLDTCRDLSASVWDEFLRQAIVEIHQGQLAKIRQVKDECIDVVNQCYESSLTKLKDFSNMKSSQTLLGNRVELSEDICKEKLDTCAYIYNGGAPGLTELLTATRNMNTLRIGDKCRDSLQEYAKSICTPSGKDIAHNYPYSCRIYAPGEYQYAKKSQCKNAGAIKPVDNSTAACVGGSNLSGGGSGYVCTKCYTMCNSGYTLNNCQCCPSSPQPSDEETICSDYGGSLYQKLVMHATEMCSRPSENTEILPEELLQDVNSVMDSIRIAMSNELKKECEAKSTGAVSLIWKDYESNLTDSNNKDISGNKMDNNYKWGVCIEGGGDVP